MTTENISPDKSPMTDREKIMKGRLITMYSSAAVLIAFVVCLSWSTVHFGLMYKDSVSDTKVAVKKVTELEKQVSELDTVKKELEDCLDKVADPDERNVSDLVDYIHARYPSVAIELAEIIAIKLNTLCKKHQIAFPLAVGLMEVESRFNPFAVSNKDARGLLQVLYSVWGKQLKLKDARELHGIECGINSGLYVLKHYIDKNKGNITKALMNYNGTKGDEFHKLVYEKVGRFTAFRTNLYGKDTEGSAEENGTAEKKGDTPKPKTDKQSAAFPG